MQGWIKLHRKIKEKAFYCKDSEKVHLWIHLLLKANHKDREEYFGGKPIICKSGEFTTGRKQLSLETGINESKIERILTYFQKIEQQIEQQKSSTNRLISILNWSEHQEIEQQIEQRVNNDRTTSEQRVNTLEELKNDKNEKNNIFSFEEFWNIYPKKISKKDCQKKFNKLSTPDLAKIKETINNFVNYKPFETYTHPNPLTYLNQQRWNDVLQNKANIINPIKRPSLK